MDLFCIDISTITYLTCPDISPKMHTQSSNAMQSKPAVIVYSATHTAAIPIPVPTHILLTPTFLLVRFNSYSSVLTCLAPVQPKGCPKAIAPPDQSSQHACTQSDGGGGGRRGPLTLGIDFRLRNAEFISTPETL